MLKVRAVLWSTALACALAAAAASAASAFPGPYYHVAGVKIGSTHKAATVTIKPGTTIKMKTTHLGVAVEIVCKAVKAEEAVVFNNTLQGETETKDLAFSECSVATPAGCTVTGGGFASKPVYSYLDYETNPEPNRTKITTYFRPTSGTEFAAVELGGTLCAGTYKVVGSVVSNNAPERAEVASLELSFPNPAITQTWDTVAGPEFKEFKAGLEVEGKTLTMIGTLVAKLASGEKIGVFDE